MPAGPWRGPAARQCRSGTATRTLRGVDAVILPGGFSYGDYLRCGAIARFAPVMSELIPAAAAGLPVLGICNGFQILCEAHLLPGALTRNAGLHFINSDVRITIEGNQTRWTAGYAAGDVITVVLKSGEGAYVADQRTLADLAASGRIVARYTDGSPNGSAADIAGDRQRGRQRRRDHAAPGARDRHAHRPRHRRARVLHLHPARSHDVMTADTVAEAVATSGREQPHAALGLTDAEYAAITAQLGRRPTDSELAIYSVMWSEHCSYKSSRKYLRQFGEKAPASSPLLAGIGQNAGVVDVGQGYAVTFKIESHNHPSYVEPFQGAATGVGGIVRDILAMGARPVAVMDALRFGPADAPDTRRVLPGVVGGISFYGNCLGLPNIGGELAFDPCYAGNPLVNALCLGVMRHADLKLAQASGPGNKVILFGSPHRARRHRRRIGPGQRLVRGERRWRRAGQAAQRPGGRPVHGEAADRVLPRAVRRGTGSGDPGPGCGRRRMRDHRAGGGRRDRHERAAGRGAAAGQRAHPARDPDERVARTHDGDHRAARPRAVPRYLRQVGRTGRRHRRGHRHGPAGR